MSRLDELPPDQRAALSLLLRQRKRYAEVAAMLAIPESAVRARAHAALAVLAPRHARELTAERRQEIGDYLLGQESVAERLATRTFLAGSEPGRAWALAISAELAQLADGALPDVPAGPAAPAAGGAQAFAQGQGAEADLAGRVAGTPSGSLPSSRLGGALLLAAIVVVIAVAVILLTSSGGSSHPKKTASTSTSTTKTTSTSGPNVTERVALHSPDPKSRSIGALEVVTESGKLAFVIAAEHLAPSHGFYYAIWLYNNHTSALPLSKSPPVGTNERLEGAASLPANAGEYKEVLLTRETSEHPTHPGLVVLRGPFSLG
ncbi:MAG TPA: sigma-70 region 4 domain-containing protein [Solirubrobacteraceae bacterium]|nr:sigma-70 region 4 domain-containing protein [Solirubrobacteraceae bacterium]